MSVIMGNGRDCVEVDDVSECRWISVHLILMQMSGVHVFFVVLFYCHLSPFTTFCELVHSMTSPLSSFTVFHLYCTC